MFSRVVIKISGEALAGRVLADCADVGGGPADNALRGIGAFDDAVIDGIVRQVKTAVAAGTQAALVLGGGNFWRGRQAQAAMDRVRADQIGMLATVMNALYLADAFARAGVGARVCTPIPIGAFTQVYERDEALRLMARGTVVVSAAGLGHPFFSTDTVTAVRAAELKADCVLFAKAIDGVYEADPRTVPGARKYEALSYRKALADRLNVADMSALHLLSEAGIPSFVFALDEPESVARACAFPKTGPLRGTLIDNETEERFYV